MQERIVSVDNLSQELQLLCEAVRRYVCTEAAPNIASNERAERLVANVDPRRLKILSAQHGTHGILANYLEEFFPDSPLASEYINARLEYAVKNLALRAIQENVLDSLQRAGFSPEVLKGRMLLQRFYDSEGARLIRDLDLDIKLEACEWSKLKDCLSQIGYTPAHILSDLHWQSLISSGASIVFIPTKDFSYGNIFRESIKLDLHFAKPDNFRFVAGVQGNLLGADEALLLYLIEHASKHTFFRLIWLVDIALLINQSGALPWSKLSEHTEAFYGLRSLDYCAELLRSIGIATPHERKVVTGFIGWRALRYIVARWDRVTSPVEFFPRNIFLHLHQCDNWRRRFYYLRWRIFELSEKDYILSGAMGESAWFNYMFRIARLGIQRLVRLFTTTIGIWKKPTVYSKAQ